MHATKKPSPTAAFASPTRSSAIWPELIRELKDPRIGMVTITGVEVTPDYAHAKVLLLAAGGRSGGMRRRR